MRAVRLSTSLYTSAAAFLALGAVAANAGGYTAPVVETGVVTPVIEAAPVADWAGGYAGLTLGYAFSGDDDMGVNDGTGTVTPGALELSGANAGIRAGYRWQRDRWVFGPELGFEGGKIDDTLSADGYEGSSEIKNVLALRMKTGYVLDNGMMVYGIAGVARAKIDYSVEGNGAAIDDSYSKTGYIVGLGAEKMLTERLSVTGEYEYANFGKETVSDGTFSTNATPDYHNVKLGLNFRF